MVLSRNFISVWYKRKVAFTFWLYSDDILTTSWIYILTTFWIYSDFILTSFWLYSDKILASFWLLSGYNLRDGFTIFFKYSLHTTSYIIEYIPPPGPTGPTDIIKTAYIQDCLASKSFFWKYTLHTTSSIIEYFLPHRHVQNCTDCLASDQICFLKIFFAHN